VVSHGTGRSRDRCGRLHAHGLWATMERDRGLNDGEARDGGVVLTLKPRRRIPPNEVGRRPPP